MVEAAPAAMTPLYEQPVLVVDPGMHTRRSSPSRWTQPGASQ